MSVCPSVRPSVRPSVGWLVTLSLFGLLGATNAVYTVLLVVLRRLDQRECLLLPPTARGPPNSIHSDFEAALIVYVIRSYFPIVTVGFTIVSVRKIPYSLPF